MKSIFSISPSRLGGLDLLLPIFLELKQQRPCRIEVIFLEDRPYMDLQRDAFLLDTYRLVVDRTTRLRGSKVRRVVQIMPTLFRMMLARNSVLLHSRSLESPLVRALYTVNKVGGGRTLVHPNAMTLPRPRKGAKDEPEPH